MCDLSWTPLLLEEDNFNKINPVYNTNKYECSQYRKNKNLWVVENECICAPDILCMC